MRRASHLMIVFAAAPVAFLAAATLIGRAAAAPLPPADLFYFPGTFVSPASAASAGLALADRWLGDTPFDHAAGALHSAVSASPMLLRTSRQDLRADNNDYTETSAFLDAAGGWAAYAPRGRAWGIAAYFSQPVLRREEINFTHGEAGAPTAPFVVVSEAESRETRTGLAFAGRVHGFELGAAPEWTSHSDRFVRDEQSAGGPTSGVTSWDFSGGAVGFDVSARGALPSTLPGHVRVGVSARYLPELAMDGTATLTPGGDTDFISVSRASAWEGGVSIEASVSPVFRVVAGAGGRTATAWAHVPARNGASTQWAIAAEYRDPEVPWRVRFGIGRDSNPGAPESAASVLGLGLGWVNHRTSLDVGVLHRGLQRGDSPTSADDRVVGSVTYRFAGD